jgi:hypothetical protein
LRSYIKIYGPPTHEAIKALEKISVEIPYVCIMNTGIRMRILESTLGVAEKLMLTPLQIYAMLAELAMKHFEASGITLPTDRHINIISSSAESLKEYDFFFEWMVKPTMELVNELIEKIDISLSQLGCYYTITTR